MTKTIFLDIDGCLCAHLGNLTTQLQAKFSQPLPGVIDKLNEWSREGHMVILTTGRKECMRAITEEMLLSLGIFYDQLVMGLPRGPRFVINDRKPNSTEDMAFAINLDRNEGLINVNI
jgi:hypothetical protein